MVGEAVIGWIREVVLDGPDPWALARFWAGLLGGTPVEWYPGWVTLEPPPHGQRLSVQATTTPGVRDVARVHFDILVEDLTLARLPRPGRPPILPGHPLTLPPNSGDGAAVLQVDQPLSAGGRPHPPPDRAPEQDERVRERDEPGFGDLLGLQHEAGERLVAHFPAVEEEPDPPWAARARAAEVHRREPRAGHVDAGLLAHLALARLPRRLPVRLHDTAGDRPAALVGRLEDQQPARPVEDERPRGYRNTRERHRFLHSRIRPRLAVTDHGPPVPLPGQESQSLSRTGPVPAQTPVHGIPGGRSFLGSLLTMAKYEASMASRSSSSPIAPPIRSVFHPERPM